MRCTKPKPKLITRQEAADLVAELAGVAAPNAATISRWFLDGVRGTKLQAHRVGGRVYFSREGVEAFLRKLNDGGAR